MRTPVVRLVSGLAGLMLLTCLALAAPPPGKKYALLVGINKYDGNSLHDLAYAENDAEELAKVLLSPDCGFSRVVLLTSKTKDRPTGANIRKALQGLLKGTMKADTILVALAGHGVQLEVRDPRGQGDPRHFAFFCASDTDLTTVNYRTGHSDTMLNLDQLFEELGRSNPGVKLVLLDACRNELKVKGSTRSLADTTIAVPNGVQALLSCGRKQTACEIPELKHGLFFYHVLKGLRGKAVNQNGEVTWASLMDYTMRQVSHDAIRYDTVQTPASVGYYEGESPVLARNLKPIGKVPAPTIVTNSLGMPLVWIPAGNFLMGSPRDEREHKEEEGPQHQVEITRGFFLGKYEVTRGQFRAFVKDSSYKTEVEKNGKGSFGFNPVTGNFEVNKAYNWQNVGFEQTDEHPVVCVSWNDAVAFCEWLSKKEGKKYRLPTEAEWEYSCRAGTTTCYSSGDNPETLTQVGNVADASFKRKFPKWVAIKGDDGYVFTAPVGRFKPNAFGLHDMHGNAEEWCQDWYDKDYYGNSPVQDPQGPSAGESRVMRGGSFDSRSISCRSADRFRVPPAGVNFNRGFRVVCVW